MSSALFDLVVLWGSQESDGDYPVFENLLKNEFYSFYIFYSSKRSRRNIKPTELTTTHIVTTYHFLPTVVS